MCAKFHENLTNVSFSYNVFITPAIMIIDDVNNYKSNERVSYMNIKQSHL